MLYGAGLGLQYCQLCYICKSTGKQKTYDFIVDLERVNTLLRKYDALLDSIRDKQEPDKPFKTEMENWQCRYCQYSHDCWGYIELEKNSREIATIPADLESQYIELSEQLNDLNEQLDMVKASITDMASGKNAAGSYLKASYVPPSESIGYDRTKLEKMIPLNMLKPCQRITRKKGYYRFSERKSS